MKRILKLILGAFIAILFIAFALRVIQIATLEEEVVKVPVPLTEVELIAVAEFQSEVPSVFSSGQVEALTQVEVAPEISGSLDQVQVEIGDKVKAGDLLMSINDDVFLAQLAQTGASVERAMATLAQAQAGPTPQTLEQARIGISQAEAALNQSLAQYEQTKLNAELSIQNAEAAVKSTKAALQEERGGSQIVGNAYENFVSTLRGSYLTIDAALQDSDNILGMDDEVGNDTFEDHLGNMNTQTLRDAERSYREARYQVLYEIEETPDIEYDEDHHDIDDAAEEMEEALEIMLDHLYDMREMLENTVPGYDDQSGLSATELAGMKASVEGAIIETQSQVSAIESTYQGIDSAEAAFKQAEVSYENALDTLDAAEDSYDETLTVSASLVEIQALSVDQAIAAYQDLAANPRSVDLAPYRASVKEAQAAYAASAANYAKTQVFAPVSGSISAVLVDQGGFAAAGQTAFVIVSEDEKQVTAYLNYTEADDVELGMQVLIDGEHQGEVLRIAPAMDPNTKKVELTILLEDQTDLVIGQFTELEIFTEEEPELLLLPLSAIKKTETETFVYTLNGNRIEAIEVELGNLEGNMVEVLKGLDESDKIVRDLRGLIPGQKVEIALN